MYNDLFNACVNFVFDREGRVYENNSDDPGGETKFGISKKSYPDINIENLTEDQAAAIYYRDYWTPMMCDKYEPRLALALFDTAVNNGVGTAQILLADFNGVVPTAEQFLFKRLRRYFNIVQKNPKMAVWLDDWLLRVLKIVELPVTYFPSTLVDRFLK